MPGVDAMVESLMERYTRSKEQAILKQVQWLVEQGVLEIREFKPAIRSAYPFVQKDSEYTVQLDGSVELKLSPGYGKISEARPGDYSIVHYKNIAVLKKEKAELQAKLDSYVGRENSMQINYEVLQSKYDALCRGIEGLHLDAIGLPKKT